MFVITIDGTAGSGKSTIANKLAKALNIKRLNTGEIYRSTENLREEKINKFTPILSSFDILRECVREHQRDFASKNDCVVEGRDIGTVVLPFAQCKFFFTASVISRAERRLKQMKDSDENLPKIIKEIERRDDIDEHREFGTMTPAKDAIIVDNSIMTVEQTLSFCLKKIKQKSLR